VLVGIAIFALIVYVFGIPAVTLGITLYARKKDLLKDKVYLRLFGLFYREYEPEFYWWDFVFLLRRFAISLCAVALSGNPDAQAGVGVLIIVVAMVPQFVYRPFWDKRVMRSTACAA